MPTFLLLFGVAVFSVPFFAQASSPFRVVQFGIGPLPTIPGLTYGTYQTALKAGDRNQQITVNVQSFSGEPVISADLSQIGFSSPTTTPLSGTNNPYHYYVGNVDYFPDWFFKFWPLTIGADVTDGLKTMYVTATDSMGNVATSTMQVLVDNVPPTFSLTDISFSAAPPKKGDTMYLSGTANGTGSALTVSRIRETIWDAKGNPVWGYGFGNEYKGAALTAAIATSTNGTFTRVPYTIIDGTPSDISTAATMNLVITAYDGSGHVVTTNLTVPVPKAPPPDPCAAPGSCASNVLFLPGIEASRLYRPDFSGGTDQLWEPNTDGDAEDLLLTADGKSIRNDVYTKDVVDEAYVVGPNIYKSFIAQMNGLKTAGTVNDWEAVPYDWRLSFDEILNNGHQFPDGRIYYSGDLAATSSPYLIQELRRLAKSSKTGKVTIVAHSNGGLLTKALTQKLGSEASALIDKIIFVAVPQAGTPQAVGAILHGYEQGLPKDWFSVFLKPEVARTLAMNMSSAYNLLPSANYFTYVDDPVVTFDNSDFLAGFRARYGSAIHSGAQLKDFVTDTWRLASSSPNDLQYPSVGNADLLSQAEAVHSALDGWIPPQGVSLHEIAGWGEDTLSTIEYKEGKRSYCSNPGDVRTCVARPAITYYPKEVVEGDGTVLVPSALWMPTSSAMKYWVDLNKYNNKLPQSLSHFDRKHADILEIPSLRALVQNILTNSTSTTPLEFITTSAPPAESTKRLRFLLHSPLDLSATDSRGNVVSASTSTVPGARWKRYGEVQVLSVPENTPITLSLNGYSAGSFTLDMEEIDESSTVVASSTFSAIPSTASTKATMAFPDGTLQNASPLQLDYDGNGTADYSLKSEIGKETVFDITPPEAILTFDPVSQKLQVTGTDNLSNTIVSTTATSSTVTDEAGNTLQIVFKKLKQEGREVKMQIQELRYNGVSVGEVPKIVLQYEWSADRAGKLKELEEKADAKGLTVEGHYDARKNATRIEEKMRGEKDKKEKESKKTLPGLVVIRLTTEKGILKVSY